MQPALQHTSPCCSHPNTSLRSLQLNHLIFTLVLKHEKEFPTLTCRLISSQQQSSYVSQAKSFNLKTLTREIHLHFPFKRTHFPFHQHTELPSECCSHLGEMSLVHKHLISSRVPTFYMQTFPYLRLHISTGILFSQPQEA